ncbi:TetR/AcrR family transcriptional regulator [Tissierella sp. MSJ-40]|uniref:TetR/AcrR family transcriptional regulator n=1 Tax=Tissierella simiarum TaxID=2841534 RepID=A0ABS6E528_9FIRM|nr:TetR/AcrR family transcriptional regulator [Tissierella simiarum]MBU5437349.1 TetR/AcrR family transcriptional regulator [Tissierella simiarum]
MPKIIDNIEEIIFQCAEKLFYAKGYDKVNMRSIAKECNIAVGTLYNYYPNKNDLYMSIVTNSWEQTFEKLDLILNNESDSNKRLIESIEILYDDITKRRGIGVHLKKIKGMDPVQFSEFQNFIIANMKKVFADVTIKEKWKEDKNIVEKLVFSLLTNIGFLIDNYPNCRNNNIEYIYNSLISFLKI